MNAFNMDDFGDLENTGFTRTEQVPPEKEFFHSLYIAGMTRKNHIDVEEIAGKLQIRGVEYNLDKVCMIITNVKEVLAKVATDKRTNKDKLECFSYKVGAGPWKGTSGRQCGSNSAERAAIDFCSTCKSQIIVSGIYCDQNGKPIVEEGKPIFIFIRAKGMKYSNVSNYLGEMYKLDLDPIFKPVTEKTKAFEKSVVNNKRYVTEVTIGTAKSQYGTKNVFELSQGAKLPDKVVMEVLNLSKKTLDKFNEKFDWSSNRMQTSGYGDKAPGILEVGTQETKKTEPETQKQTTQDFDMSFEGIEF